MATYGLFIISGLAVGILYALGGVGLVVLYRTTGVLNFAYGALGALGAMLGWQILQWGGGESLAWAVSILAGAALSMVFGHLVGPALASRDTVVKAVATLGFALCILGLMNLLWIDTPRRLALSFDKIAVSILGLRVTGTRLLALAAGIVITTGIGVYLKYTRTGLMMRSIAVNRGLSSILGIPIRSIEAIAWCVSGALAGFTGMLFGDLVRLDPATLTFMVIPLIAATLIGRLQSIPITFAAGLSIGVVESLMTLVKPLAPLRAATPFVIATIVLLWMQRGRKLTFADHD